MLDVSIAAILETKDRRIILVNGHIINVYRHTTSNPDKNKLGGAGTGSSLFVSRRDFIVISRAVRERCNFYRRNNKIYCSLIPGCSPLEISHATKIDGR